MVPFCISNCKPNYFIVVNFSHWVSGIRYFYTWTIALSRFPLRPSTVQRDSFLFILRCFVRCREKVDSLRRRATLKPRRHKQVWGEEMKNKKNKNPSDQVSIFWFLVTGGVAVSATTFTFGASVRAMGHFKSRSPATLTHPIPCPRLTWQSAMEWVVSPRQSILTWRFFAFCSNHFSSLKNRWKYFLWITNNQEKNENTSQVVMKFITLRLDKELLPCFKGVNIIF